MQLTRRELLAAIAAATIARSARAEDKPTMLTRAIPKTGEKLPVIGLGTWQTFDVGDDRKVRAAIADVLRAFLDAGARVIDSSPMYGRAEQVTGDELAAIDAIGKPFLATKVWTSGKREGIEQMKRSISRMRATTLDLMQVHNLLDHATHLPVLHEWKAVGTIRYIGVTHYQHGQFDAIEKLMRAGEVDFIQVPYSIVDRRAEQRVLPAALDTGTAVLVMTPFESGRLFAQVRGKPLPAWAADIDCTSWAQLFLKFVIAHPAVTCPIPATANAKHVVDNARAGSGRLPDEAMRKKMAAALA
jgi:aryl-alcohol dehydrogenase-like predicted oxidoreductase